MSILAVSVSHKTTSVDVLSRVAMDAATATKLAQSLLSGDHVDEAVVLSTCNRTEMYVSVSRFHGGLDDVTSSLADLSGVAVAELRQMCAVYFDEGAVAHAFAVAAGLESMVIGENQILGQVKAALTTCQANGTVGTVLNALFQQALRVGKRVHTETEIGSAGRSLVTAAYELLETDLGPVAGRRLLVLGAGSMAGLAARTAAAAGAQVTCVNRTYERARRLATAIGGRARPLGELDAASARPISSWPAPAPATCSSTPSSCGTPRSSASSTLPSPPTCRPTSSTSTSCWSTSPGWWPTSPTTPAVARWRPPGLSSPAR